MGNAPYPGGQKHQHEPIIDPETFYAVQRLLDAQRGTRGQGRGRPSAGSHLFRNAMLHCGRCGGPMDPRTNKRQNYEAYMCRNQAHDECDQPQRQRADIDDSFLGYFKHAILDVEATLAQLQATEDARREEVTEQRKQAEGEQLRLKGEREHVEREFRAGDLSGGRYDKLCDDMDDEQAAADVQVQQLRARERELSSESMVAAITAERAESLSEIRAAIVEHVLGAGDLDGVRAKLLPVFEKFVYVDMSVPYPTRRLAPGDRVPDEIVAREGAFLELYLRPEAIRELVVQEEDGAEWWGAGHPPGRAAAANLKPAFHAGKQSVLRLSVAVIERLQPGDEAEAAPVDLVRPGVVTNIVWLTGAVGEKCHGLLPGPQEMGDPRARRA